jgi:ribonuclease PH
MDFRSAHQMRPLTITPNPLSYPEGSAWVHWGNTQVLCTASLEDRVPPFLLGKQVGWVSAEYDMLPRATQNRRARDAHKGKINGRTQEISRFIGRSLRAGCNMQALGERSLMVDCDVLQADGGTRTAAITGGFVALALAVRQLADKGLVSYDDVILHHVAALSVGSVRGTAQVDLDYEMDSQADVDMNIVMTDTGKWIEIQGCAERQCFDREQLNTFLDLALQALPQIVAAQRAALTV